MNNTVPDDHRRERQTPSVPQSDDTQMTEALMRQSTNTIDQRPKAMKYKKEERESFDRTDCRRYKTGYNKQSTTKQTGSGWSRFKEYMYTTVIYQSTNCRKWKQFRRFNVPQSACTVRDGVPCNVPHRCIITVEPSSPGWTVMAETQPLTLTEPASASSS